MSREKKGFIPPTPFSSRNIKVGRSVVNLRGFTLLEILITIVLLSVGMVGITKAFSSGFIAVTDVENVSLALDIAQAEMEIIRDTSFNMVLDKGPTPDSVFSDFNVTHNVSEGQNPKQVDVTVAWDVKGEQNTITLTTLVADY